MRFTAYLAVGGLLVFPSSKEKISQSGIELPTPPFTDDELIEEFDDLLVMCCMMMLVKLLA